MLNKIYQVYTTNSETGLPETIMGLWSDNEPDANQMFEDISKHPDFKGKKLALVETSFKLIKGDDLTTAVH